MYKEFKLGRRFLGRLPNGKDLIASIQEFCQTKDIKTASFSLIGAVSYATLGAYDQRQKKYMNFSKNEFLEIVSCTGNISIKDKKPFVHAHAVLGDERGNVFGGHLFSETIIFAGEIDFQELLGISLERHYDNVTGLMLWEL